MIPKIRKLSIGIDQKNSIHYVIGNNVFDDHKISEMTIGEVKGVPFVFIYVQKENVQYMWKMFPLQFCLIEGDLSWAM